MFSLVARRLTEAELVEAGRRVIARGGLANATLERIAREAGVSRVTLHRRGLTLDQIVSRLTERATADYRDALWPALTSSASAAERLEQALDALCDVAERHLELLGALGGYSDAVFHEEGGEVLTRSIFTEPLERILRDGARDGTLGAADPLERATVLFNLVGWTYLHLRRGHGWPADRARGATLELALKGALARSQQQNPAS